MMRLVGWMLSMAAVATMATAADYEVTPLAGFVVKEGNLNLENERLIGAEVQFNTVSGMIKPEVSVLYTPEVDYDPLPASGASTSIIVTSPPGGSGTVIESTSITRFALNGVYEYPAVESLTPFAKAGFGYEEMEKNFFDNGDDFFLDVGAGIKMPLADAVALKAEALYMLKDPFDRADNNLALMVGLTFSFGGGTTAAGLPDSDNDGVADADDDCPDTPMEAQVDEHGCPLDSDNDGVIDLEDACPNTQPGFKVDKTGCPERRELEVMFRRDADVIDAAYVSEVEAFGRFLMDNPAQKVHIIGHTDSRASERYNVGLSIRRANAVRNMLVDQGIDASRISTEGRGETEPRADNATSEGRQANRRIQVELSH